MWTAIQGSPSLRVLTLDASFFSVPKAETFSVPSLESLATIVWDRTEFFSSRGQQISNDWEMVTWRGLVKHVSTGCPQVCRLELLLAKKVPPEQVGEICRGSQGLHRVEVVSSTYKTI